MPCDNQSTVFKKPAKSFFRIFAAHAMLLLSPLAVLAGNVNVPANFAGVYVARVAKSAPSMTVSLGADGTATVTGDLGNGSMTSFGSWQGDGHQIKVTFNAEEGAPSDTPMVFTLGHNELHAVSWNHQTWGTAQPPVMTKGYKVKYLLWSTNLQ